MSGLSSLGSTRSLWPVMKSMLKLIILKYFGKLCLLEFCKHVVILEAQCLGMLSGQCVSSEILMVAHI